MGEDKTVALNRRATHDYDVLRRWEAGLALTGTEIKSIREGHANIREAYARPINDEVWLVGANIAGYGPAGQFGHEPTRSRKLLLHRKEIEEIERAVNERGLTLVPLRLYLKNGRAKVEVGLARGRKVYDKREAIAKRDAERQMQRALRHAVKR
jgi:SsrA-binding protein